MVDRGALSRPTLNDVDGVCPRAHAFAYFYVRAAQVIFVGALPQNE